VTGAVVWFTGLPASGKSTLALAVRRALKQTGVLPCLLDGDVVRNLLAPSLGYSPAARTAFYSALTGLAAELAHQGLTVLVAATAHERAFRSRARSLSPRFIEVWISTPLEECRRRDPKGLYAAAGGHQAGSLPGVDVAYEPPEDAELVASGGEDAQAVARILSLLRDEKAESGMRSAPR
jgi:adenylylsulfate kinase